MITGTSYKWPFVDMPASVAKVLLCAAVVLLCLVGCGGGPDLPPTAPVSGTVTLDGKPVPRGMVQFVPDASQGTQGPPAVGAIDSDGHYELSTAGVEGAVVGRHRVRVDAREPWTNDDDPPPESLIPERYNNPGTSGLTVEVQPDTHNSIDLPLSSGSP